jgi:hypothetical protein
MAGLPDLPDTAELIADGEITVGGSVLVQRVPPEFNDAPLVLHPTVSCQKTPDSAPVEAVSLQ